MEQTTPVTTPAAAAPPPAAPPAAAPKEVTGSDVLSSMTAAQRETWRKTGEIPDSKTPEFAGDQPSTEDADSSAAQPVEQASDAAEHKEPGSEPGARPDKRAAEHRIPELLKQIKDLEAKLADPSRVSSPQAQPQATIQAAPSPAAAPALGPKPDATDYEKYPLGSADPQFVEDMSDWKAKAILADHQASLTKADAEQKQKAAAEAAGRELTERTNAIKATHPDFEDVVKTVKGIAPGSPLDAFILGSKRFGFETLYHLGKNPAELARIMAIGDVIEQVEELVLLGHSLTTPPVVKTKTSAPPPPGKLETRTVNQSDDAASAMARGDFRSYRDAENARELAAKKK